MYQVRSKVTERAQKILTPSVRFGELFGMDDFEKSIAGKSMVDRLREEARSDLPLLSHDNKTDPLDNSRHLLHQIAQNTEKTAFWVRVMGVPVLIGFSTPTL